MKIKIYSNDEVILSNVAINFNLQVEIIKERGRVVGKGYCSSGDYLRVFTEDSEVDNSEEFITLDPKEYV